MALTISLSTLLCLGALLTALWAAWRLYDAFVVSPRKFLSYWASQGVHGVPYAFPLGELPAIQRAADSDEIIPYAQSMRARYGAIHTQQVGPICQLIVTDPEVARYIFTSKAHCYHKATDAQKEILRPLLHNGLLLSEDAYWKQQRTLLSPGFHYFYLQEMVPIIVDSIKGWCEKTEGEIDAAAASGAATEASVEREMAHELSTMTLDSVATAAFGSGFREDQARADRFIHALKSVLEHMQARSLNLLGFLPVIKDLPLPSLKAIQRGCATIDEVVGEIVRDRKAGLSAPLAGGEHAGSQAAREQAGGGEVRRRDLLDLLLDAQSNMPPGGVLTDKGVEEESVNFITAGAETTSNLCVWMLYRLVNMHEEGIKAGSADASILTRCIEEVDRVCQGALPGIEELKELKFIEAVAYESLRLHAPAPSLPKHCIESHEITLYSGPEGERTITIPAGTTIIINANVIHRLEEYWPNAEEFRPERFLSSSSSSSSSANASGNGASAGAADEDAADADSGATPAAASSSTSGSTAKSAPLTAAEKARRSAQSFAFLGFSAGPRKCIGKNLAMLEIKVIFTLLLQRFSFSLVPGQKIAAHAITRMPKDGIRMRVTRRRKDAPVAGADGEQQEQETQGNKDGVRQRGAAASATAGVSVLKPLGMI